MVTANKCTSHICCSRKNSLSFAKPTSIGRNKNKLWAGSANAQINPAMTMCTRSICGCWCGLKKTRLQRGKLEARVSLMPVCVIPSLSPHYILQVILIPILWETKNRIELITTSEEKGTWHVFCNMNSPFYNNAVIVFVPMNLQYILHDLFTVLERFVDRDYLLFRIIQCNECLRQVFSL